MNASAATAISDQTNTCFIPELTKTIPFKHQAETIEETKNLRYFGLFMEQGTGKSHITIATFTHLWYSGQINGVLILAPNGVHDNWVRDEIPTHCVLTEDEMVVASWHSSDSKRKKEYFNYVAGLEYDFEGEEHRLVVLAANIEAVRTTAFMAAIRPFMERRDWLLVVDESTTIKNPKADQSKMVHKLAKNASASRILTGTPITQSPLDLWSQCRALDEQALPYPSFTAFKHEFAIEETVFMGQRQFQKVVGYKNQDKLASLIAPFTKRILKKDCLDLPEKIYQTRYVELTPEQHRIYKDLTKQCLAKICAENQVTVTTAITMLLRLHQVTLGYVQTDDGTMQHIEHNRISVLSDIIDENMSKAIIFVRFLEDVRQITEFLLERKGPGFGFVIYDGAVTPEGRQRAIQSFQNDPDCRYFIATSAAARGLTLTAAEQVIYYSQGFSLETRLQSEDRAHRIGQTKNVIYTDLVAQGTVDEKVIAALRAKKEIADSILSRTEIEHLIQLEE